MELVEGVLRVVGFFVFFFCFRLVIGKRRNCWDRVWWVVGVRMGSVSMVGVLEE